MSKDPNAPYYAPKRFIDLATKHGYDMTDFLPIQPLPLIEDASQKIAKVTAGKIDEALRTLYPGLTDDEMIDELSVITHARTSRTNPNVTDYIIRGEVAFVHEIRLQGTSVISEIRMVKSRTSD